MKNAFLYGGMSSRVGGYSSLKDAHYHDLQRGIPLHLSQQLTPNLWHICTIGAFGDEGKIIREIYIGFLRSAE